MQSISVELKVLENQFQNRHLGDQATADNCSTNNLPKLSIISMPKCNGANGIETSEAKPGARRFNVPILNLPEDSESGYVDELSEITVADLSDDTSVIDLVMASNKGPISASSNHSRASSASRRINSGNLSTVKPNMKVSRNRKESKMSLNSDSDDSGDQDSEDEAMSSSTLNNNVTGPAQAWAAFENVVKNIDNTSAEYFVRKPKPNFVSSGTFQKVMVDMYGNTEYGNTKGYTLLKMKLNNMARATGMATRMFNGAVAKGKVEREDEEQGISSKCHDDDVIDTREHVAQEGARRGWRLLKRQVNEQTMENKLQGSKLNWTMLQQTVKQMTNTERTRQDLYERYGILPTRLSDGRIVCENQMLSERARAQIYGDNREAQPTGHDNKRPSSYQPPPVHLRPKSHSSYKQTGYDKRRSENGSKRVMSSVRKLRPKTAK